MCGIVAIFGLEDAGGRLTAALDRISHRGSARHETWSAGNAALGANRLPIIAPETGRQPKFSEDGNLIAVMNGEIFNFQALNEELARRGHRIATACDTETLVHLYEEFGDACVERIDSEMFAFVVYNRADDSFFAARDPLGVKPLYYAQVKGVFYLASEIKALSIFDDIEEIHEFPAGHFCRDGVFHAYRQEIPAQAAPQDFSQAKSGIRDCLIAAVRKRLPPDQKLAVLLSGGVDSSLIMALAQAYHPDVTAFILGAEFAEDRIFAERLCRDKGWKYEIVPVDDIDYAREFRDIVYYAESSEPNIIRHSFAQDRVAAAIHRKGYKVALTGEGADEIFAGYNEFKDLPPELINRGCALMLESMALGNLMRVDKLCMRHTIEARCPFFDGALVNLGLATAADFKILRAQDRVVTKHILREVAREFLPDYIVDREKIPFANGAGMDVGNNFTSSDGVLSRLAGIAISDSEFSRLQSRYPQRQLRTKEDAMLFLCYESFGYAKFKNTRRPVMKDTLAEALREGNAGF